MNYHSDEWIMQGLQYHYDEILKLKPNINIFALVLRGSQNYGIDTEESDIDSRCIYIPSQEQLEEEIKSEEILLPTGEQITFLDIRLFTHGLIIRSLYYVELLYSKWYIIPEQQNKELWKQYQSLANDLISSNKSAAAKSIIFYANKKQEFLFNNFQSFEYEDCIKRGYSRKSLYHIVRYHLLLQLLNSDSPFENCMSEELNSQTVFVKSGTMPLASIQWLMLSLPRELITLQKDIECNYPPNIQKCQQIETQLIHLQNQIMEAKI